MKTEGCEAPHSAQNSNAKAESIAKTNVSNWRQTEASRLCVNGGRESRGLNPGGGQPAFAGPSTMLISSAVSP